MSRNSNSVIDHDSIRRARKAAQRPGKRQHASSTDTHKNSGFSMHAAIRDRDTRADRLEREAKEREAALAAEREASIASLLYVIDGGNDITLDLGDPMSHPFHVVKGLMDKIKDDDTYAYVAKWEKGRLLSVRFWNRVEMQKCRALIENARKHFNAGGLVKVPFDGMPLWVQNTLLGICEHYRLEGQFIVLARAKAA